MILKGLEMKIGQLVKAQLPQILKYCDTQDHEEFVRLCSPEYSKKHFNINFPLLMEANQLTGELSKRYWTNAYIVRGKTVRACSQWFGKDTPYFLAYLQRIGIEYDDALVTPDLLITQRSRLQPILSTTKTNSRYRGNAIGNAQNLLIRNVLSNLGTEQFTEEDWLATKEYFGQRCAYCGEEKSLVIEHAIPINKQYLGEHRLGNLVPSCQECNSAKASKDFREFLDEDENRIKVIEGYMDSRNYVPLEENEQVRMILEMAYREVGSLAERYIQIINGLFIIDANVGK